MDFMWRTDGGRLYSIQGLPKGVCVSAFQRYTALIIDGLCVSWCQDEEKLDYTEMAKRPRDWDYKIVANLTCWDLLTILEAEFNKTEDLLELCYPAVKNVTKSTSEVDAYQQDGDQEHFTSIPKEDSSGTHS